MTHQVSVHLRARPTRVRLLGPDEPWPPPPSSAPPLNESAAVDARAAAASPRSLASSVEAPNPVEDLARLADKLHRALNDFSRQMHSHREAWRQGAVELGILVAAHILKHSVESGTFPWSVVIDEMTATLTGTPVEVRLHPTDLEIWQRAQPEAALPPGVCLVADGQLRRGECLVASDLEVRLHSWADRLRSARETLLREWERDPI